MAFLGKNILTKAGLLATNSLNFKNPVLIYFSASWCPPCRAFTPMLAEFYKGVNNPAAQCEIIFASLDESEKEFKDYYDKMPWSALAFSEKSLISSLAGKYGVQSIPTLVLVNDKGDSLSKDCRNEVASKGIQALKTFKTLLG